MTLLEPPVSALPHGARAAAGALRALSRASLPVLLVALGRAADPPLSTDALGQALAALVLAPELCARLVLHAFAADVEVTAAALVVAGALQRIEVPVASLARARAWRIALPSPGLSLALQSGARLPVERKFRAASRRRAKTIGLAAREIEPLLAALAHAGIAAPADAALAYARARAADTRRWWDRPGFAIGLASLLPAVVAFHAHQHIAFGGTLGEYYLMGLGAWLATALRYEVTSVLYLVLWYGCFRLAVELIAWAGALAAPARAAGVRRIAARAAALLYYASIPTLLALRFLS